MSFEPLIGVRGRPRVLCKCDDCGREETVAAQHGVDGKQGEGQCIKKLAAQGWSFIKHRLRCPACESKRKVAAHYEKQREEAHEMAEEEAAPREPTKTQKREIMDMLGEVYDIERERYIGTDTDETIADVLGVMPGWVAKIRDEFFGPDGGNAEMSDLAEATRTWLAQIDEQFKTLASEKVALLKVQSEGQALLDRLEKITRAVGPRVMRVVGK